LAVLLPALIAVACSRGSLNAQASDGGADRDPGADVAKDQRAIDVGGSIDVGSLIDAGGSIDVGGSASDASDGPAGADVGSDTPGTGAARRSYVVQSLFTSTVVGDAAPASQGHQFTLVVDTNALVAVAGTPAGVITVPLTSTDRRTFRAVTPFSLPLNMGCSGLTLNATYDELTFVVDEAGLSGQSTGRIFSLRDDIGSVTFGAFALTGTRDMQAPVVSGIPNTNPLAGFRLRASEPLPPDVSLSLVSATGESLPFAVTATGGPLSAVHDFDKPAVGLRYDTAYRVAVDAVVDFAGNAAAPSGAVTFTTGPAPPLIPEDGFESATGTTLGGASLLSGSGVLAGNKSLYAPVGTTLTTMATSFALRLALQPGDTMIRFSYQLVQSSATGFAPSPKLVVGSVGGMLAGTTLAPGTGTYSPVQLSTGTVYVSATATAEIPLPAGAAGEIVIQLTAGTPYMGCGPPPPPGAGIILDDLRVE
jgi:hypothetical protein